MNIGAYTLRTWGETQAARYIAGLEVCCQMVADNPELGRACDYVRPGLRRMEHSRHVVFYRHKARGILVSRILVSRILHCISACCPEDRASTMKTSRGRGAVNDDQHAYVGNLILVGVGLHS